jgi:hypothetical protein
MLYVKQTVEWELGIGRGNRSARKKPAQVSLRLPQIPPDLGLKPGRRGGKPATNRLSYGAAAMLGCSQIESSREIKSDIMRIP